MIGWKPLLVVLPIVTSQANITTSTSTPTPTRPECEPPDSRRQPLDMDDLCSHGPRVPGLAPGQGQVVRSARGGGLGLHGHWAAVQGAQAQAPAQ